MSHAASKSTLIGIFAASLIVLSIACLIIIQAVRAQDAPQSQHMGALLETLNQRIEHEPPFHVTIKFAQPITDSSSLFWEVPYISADSDVSRWIGEIGDDFVCFYEHTGEFNLAHCTPFSNIVSVNYID